MLTLQFITVCNANIHTVTVIAFFFAHIHINMPMHKNKNAYAQMLLTSMFVPLRHHRLGRTKFWRDSAARQNHQESSSGDFNIHTKLESYPVCCSGTKCWIDRQMNGLTQHAVHELILFMSKLIFKNLINEFH